MKAVPGGQPHLAVHELRLAASAEWSPSFRGWAFLQIKSGVGYWRQAGTVRELEPGSSVVLAKDARGTFLTSQLNDVALSWFSLEPEKLAGLLSLGDQQLLQQAAAREQFAVRVLPPSDPASEHFKTICLSPTGTPLQTRLQLLELFCELFRNELDDRAAASEDEQDGQARLRQFLKQLPAEEFLELSLGDLAPKMHCSPRHLSRLFRKEVGMSFRDKQTELRLAKACELLATSNAKVIDVASTSGYQSTSLFSLLFKKRFGVSPGKWRLRHGWRNARPAKLANLLPVMMSRIPFPPHRAELDPVATARDAAGISIPVWWKIFLLFLGVATLPSLSSAADTNAPTFNVQTYVLEGRTLLPTNDLLSVVSKHTGTNVSLNEIVLAAEDLLAVYRANGHSTMGVALSKEQITNGIVTLHIFEGVFPQVVVSGRTYYTSREGAGLTNAMAGAATNSAATNAAPARPQVKFAVAGFEISGSTLLPEEALQSIFAKYTATNVTFADISSALKELQAEYHARGYDIVNMSVPPQQFTNGGVFKISVFEGRIAEIKVFGNRYYSSNNVMRALPGVRTNMVLNSKVFQAELDRANANQDRQVSPRVEPGPEPYTSLLRLDVKDRLPFHAKTEFNNQSSPGTPETRLNTSAVYNNLWQQDHALGVQYSFSPEKMKDGGQWNFYDRPLVANYSAFYRMPLANPGSIGDAVAERPGTFGYDEATRRFELPQPSGTPELNAFASRSTIDTGVTSSSPSRLFTSINRTIDQQSDHQDITLNEDVGLRLSQPFDLFGEIHSILSASLDFKWYRISSFTTNNFIFTEHLLDSAGNPFTRVSVTPSPVPPTTHSLGYIPLSLRWDANIRDKHGRTDFSLNYNPNLWFGGNVNDFQTIAGSTHSSGHWHIIGASLTRDEIIHGEWRLNVRADGQWSSEPLISNEQFGVGGVNGVRGYREGESFGDTGWRLTSELKTPPHVIGFVGTGTSTPLSVRASIFTDYAQTYHLDPAAGGTTTLWGAGVGTALSLGPHFDAHLLFGVPLTSTFTSEAGQVRVSFAVGAQF